MPAMAKSEDRLTMTVGRNIARLRKQFGFSQTELGGMVDQHPNSVSRHERGETVMSLHLVYRYAEALGVGLDVLTGRENADALLRVVRAGPVYVLKRAALLAVQQARSWRPLWPFYKRGGIEVGCVVDQDDEYCSEEQYMAALDDVRRKMRQLGSVPEEWRDHWTDE